MLKKICFALLSIGALNSSPVPLESVATLPGSTREVIRIYLIRNGESEYSAKDANGVKYTSGKSPHVPLTEKGVEQAKHLGELLSSRIKEGVVYTPPAMRAVQTASFLNVSQGATYEGLLEVGMGDWEGKPKDQVYQDEYQKWKDLSAQEKFITPKVASGESYFDASERAFKDLQTILHHEEGRRFLERKEARTIFIVSGENLLRALALRWAHPELSQEKSSQLPIWTLDPCDLFLVEVPLGQPIENGKIEGIYLSSQ